ncbi:hypothetical protein JB92DRAFT_2837724 [Gautieria morchelliformis]|nr:hypothetical protein JB92DRAFT_2837724 [Gautieria morchelliformis]
MFHLNVSANGELCLDILQNRWNPTYDVASCIPALVLVYERWTFITQGYKSVSERERELASLDRKAIVNLKTCLKPSNSLTLPRSGYIRLSYPMLLRWAKCYRSLTRPLVPALAPTLTGRVCPRPSMHAGLSPPKLHHSGSLILLPPLCFTPHPANHREFHDTCPPPAAPACAEPACVAARDCGVLSLPPTGRPGESIPIPPPFTLQPRPNPAPPAGSGVTRAVQGTIGWMAYLSGWVGIALRDAIVYRFSSLFSVKFGSLLFGVLESRSVYGLDRDILAFRNQPLERSECDSTFRTSARNKRSQSVGKKFNSYLSHRNEAVNSSSPPARSEATAQDRISALLIFVEEESAFNGFRRDCRRDTVKKA